MIKASVVVFCGEDSEFYLHLFPRKDETGLESPGGKLEKNETFIQGAIREIEEETSIILKEEDLIFFSFHEHQVQQQKYFLFIYLCYQKKLPLKKYYYSHLNEFNLAFSEDIEGIYLEIKNFLQKCRTCL